MSRTGPAKAELFGSAFREAGDLWFVKAIVREIFDQPRETKAAQIALSRIRRVGQKRGYSDRTVWDFFYASKNLHLIDYVVSGRRRVWKPTPNGISWIILDPDLGKALSLTDRVFLLRILLMVDSNNCGLWLTSVLRGIEDNQNDNLAGARIEAIKKTFEEKLRAHGIDFHGETVDHKFNPALGWAVHVGLVEQEGDTFQVTNEGAEIAKLHERFLALGYEAFRREAGTEIANSVRKQLQKSPTNLPATKFEAEIDNVTRQIRVRLKSRRPIAVPILRNVYCTRLLRNGETINDEEFDNNLLQISRTHYYKYALTRSRESMRYPYPGIEMRRGSLYYFNLI